MSIEDEIAELCGEETTKKKLSAAAQALIGEDVATPPAPRRADRGKTAMRQMVEESSTTVSPTLLERTLDKIGDKMWRLRSGMYLILNEKGVVEPFVLRPEQEEFLINRHFRNFVPKARKLGMSTLIVLDYLDDCLFNKNFKCGVIDLKQADAEDKLAIARFAWDKGAEHPKPEFRFLWQRIHARNPMENPSLSRLSWKNGSTYTAGTRYTGKTPRKLHCSEFGPIAAQTPRVAEDIVRGSFNSVPMGGTIDIETTMEGGRIGECYAIFKLALKTAGYEELEELDWKCHFFSWLGHPSYQLPGSTPERIRPETREYFARIEAENGDWLEKQFGWRVVPINRRAWYQAKKDTLRDFMYQQFPTIISECDMATVVGQIYPEFTNLRAEGRVTNYNPEPHLPLIVCADLGSSANTALWLVQPAGHATNILDCAFGEGAGAAWVAEQVRKWEDKHKLTIIQVLVPHDARITDKGSGLTYEQQLVKAKIPQAKITVVPRTPDVWVGIDETRKLWANAWFHSRTDEVIRDEEGREFPSGVARLEGYRCKPPGSTGAVANTPLHDICSHAADGMRTYGEAKAQHLVRLDYRLPDSTSMEERGAPSWWLDGGKKKIQVKMRKG